MKVQYLTDKGSGKVNEDSLLIAPNVYGVFDGQTGLIKHTDANGNTGGLIASQTAKEIFGKNSDIALLEITGNVLNALKSKMSKTGISQDEKSGFWGTTASVVRISNGSKSIEYLRIGDSPIIIVGKNSEVKTFYFDHDLQTTILWKKLADEGINEIRKDSRMQAQLIKNRGESNINYGMLNGEKEALKFVQIGRIPLDGIKYILILTDGALIPKQNPDDPEDFAKIVALFEEGGLKKIKSYVRELENSDPNCLKYLRFKPHDDLTAIAITL